MDNVLVDFRSSFVRIDPLLLKEFEGHLDDIPDLFSKMDPMPDAVDSFNRLAAVFDTYILSTAPWDNPSAWSDKLNWVKKHLGKSAYKRLILSHHKNLNDGDFLVDDRLKNGVEGFKGEHIHFGTDRFPDWTSTTTYLINRT
jgi:5'-nucleotidase